MTRKRSWIRIIVVGIAALALLQLILAEHLSPTYTAARPVKEPTPTLSPGEPWQPGRLAVTIPQPQRLPSVSLTEVDRERIIQQYLAEEWKYRVHLDEQPQTFALAASQANGPIIYAGDDGNLWIMEANGTNPRQLTTTFSDISNPVWSPTGDRIAFIANNSSSIFVTDANGNNPTKIVSNFANTSWVSWSPDNARLVFTGTEAGNVRGTYVVNHDGTGRTRLAANLGEHSLGASWSPDGQWVALPAQRSSGIWGIYKINVTDQQGSWLPGEFSCSLTACSCPAVPFTYFAAWSPNSVQIAFAGTRTEEYKCGVNTCCRSITGVYLVNADGSSNPQLIGDLSRTDNPQGYSSWINLVWNSNASRLATQALWTDGTWRTCTASPSEGVTALTGETGTAAGGADWASDASQLVTSLTQANTNNIYIVDVATDSWGTPVAQGFSPSWGDSLDSDGDGLLDDWETNGFDTDGDGDRDLNLQELGADKDVKDIFVRVDWLQKEGPGAHSHQPTAEKGKGLDLVKTSFAKQGINLHIVLGTGILETQAMEVLGSSEGCIYFSGEFKGLREQFLLENGTRPRMGVIFHYAIFGHYLPEFNCACKLSNGPAWGITPDGTSDFIVALQPAIDAHNRGEITTEQLEFVEGLVFMHELGHTLGLHHGGIKPSGEPDTVNFKPNHLSIMNYAFGKRGLIFQGQGIEGLGLLDYSKFGPETIPNLKENGALDERLGLNGGNSIADYGTVYYCGRRDKSGRVVPNANGVIDWDCDGTPSETNVKANINADETIIPLVCPARYSDLVARNEWDYLVFTHGSIGSLREPISEYPTETTLEEPEWPGNEILGIKQLTYLPLIIK